MSLNNFRDEAGEFLKLIAAKNDMSDTLKINMLEEEFNILKEVMDNPDKLKHQIYDMLFILFEIASDHQFDLDSEWNEGRKRKEAKYISTCKE
ncbi:hypothetical protein Desor_3162 [Desulfosporosinus orientis DSM 765]|uniref:MazG nucleotide pyrophosphohydrolase family protein n=1 Tax=Desulfosporosinus orientis (strain ATCC 19365 / DSM 765 / NCIMB 8382 / VKM B-1628 / Singapore I) TaxID=768706 RepID=G7W6N2_DESOD|nr:hypothetical protein [Desulfosporosinus orientis]AET68670.1 hypothetical protein Desor_3162 [Desulfosporosinus orientis DSM 765]